MSDTNVREQLKRLYAKHRQTPFPKYHDDPEIQELHGHLIVYDAEVAGYISRVLKDELVIIPLLEERPSIRHQIEELLQRKPNAFELLQRYLVEYDCLVEMIKVARKLV